MKNWTLVAKKTIYHWLTEVLFLGSVDRAAQNTPTCWEVLNTISMSIVSELLHERTDFGDMKEPILEFSKEEKAHCGNYQIPVDIFPSSNYSCVYQSKVVLLLFSSPIPPLFLLNIYTLLNELDLLFAKHMNEIFTGEH